MYIIDKSKRLPTLTGFILEQEEAPEPTPLDEPSGEEVLNQQLTDLGNTRNEILDQQQQARAEGDLITSQTADIDIQIIDFQMQIARLEADKVKLSKEGV